MDNETTRLYLHSSLETAFPDLGLYFSPPGDMMLDRPCIVYEPKEIQPSYANSVAYVIGVQYQVTLLSNNPGYSDVWNVYKMPGVVVERAIRFVLTDIVHNVFTVSVNSI